MRKDEPMNKSGFDKLYWGFLFVMIDFKIQGFDILPDIVGYILFAIGFSILAERSTYFKKSATFNIPMIILSILSIYEQPSKGSGIQLGQFGLLSIPIAIAGLVFSLLVVYNLFLGIKEMAETQGQMDIYSEADNRWRQFLMLQLVALLAIVLIFIPPLALIFIVGMLIASIALTVVIMKLMQKCGEYL